MPVLLNRCFLASALFAVASTALAAPQKPDEFTPVVVSTLTPNAEPVLGSDGKQHVVYELVLTNTNVTTATLQKVEVVDAARPSRVVAQYAGSDLLKRLHATNNTPAKDTEIEWNGTRLLLLHLVFDPIAAIPRRLEHRLILLGAPGPYRQPVTPVSLRYTVAPLNISVTIPELARHWLETAGLPSMDAVSRMAFIALVASQ
jgi:hypothetical protein